MMGDKATLRLARQELEDLYLGVPDDSVDLTFRDFAFKPAAAPGTALSSGKPLPVVVTTTNTASNLPNNAAVAIANQVSVDADGGERNKNQTTAGAAFARSTTNIFTYRPLEDHKDVVARGGGGGGGGGLAGAAGGGGGSLLQLPPIPASPLSVHLAHSDDDDDEDYADHQYHYPEAPAPARTATSGRPATAATGDHHQAASGRRPRRSHVADDAMGGQDRRAARSNNFRRPGIPHSNICALCNNYVYVFRHRCLVCGRVYCRRCVGAGMGDMTEGRKCIDCLGRRYSHRYIHRAGDTGRCGLCFWGNAKAVTAQELIWAEKGPAPRRRPRPYGHSSISASYAAGDGGYYSSTNTIASASMSMTMNSDSSITMMKMNGGHGRSISGMPASASSSFVAAFPNNPHALPL